MRDCFEDHFEMDSAACLLRRRDLIKHALVFAGQEICPIDNHVDFVGAVPHGSANLLKF